MWLVGLFPMTTYARNRLVAWLLDRAYGQRGTVAVPTTGAPSDFLLGKFPPGIEDVLERVFARHDCWTAAGNEVDWCFLVGGPGNGKSEALRYIASRLGVTLPPRTPRQPAPRTIPDGPDGWPTRAHPLANGLGIAFINDASIPRPSVPADGSTPGSLFHDVADALARTARGEFTSLFANVNRGILVEERGGLRAVADWATETESRRLAAGLIHWLASQGDTGDGPVTVINPTSMRPQYGQFKLSLATAAGLTVTVFVHVVFLDVLSLLEPTPGSGGPVVSFESDPPEVAQYLTLGRLRLVSLDTTRDNTIAGSLVQLCAAPDRWEADGCRDSNTRQLCAAHSHCPFAQNARWLHEQTLRHRFLDTLRAAEIAANRRLTYRDLLGHVSLAVIGPPEQEWLKNKHPCEWVANQHQAVSTEATDQKSATVRLARHRIYTNLYPGSGFAVTRDLAEKRLSSSDRVFNAVLDHLLPSGEAARIQPYEKAFAEIDRDTETWGTLRKRALDAIEALDIESPSDQMTAWAELPAAAGSDIELKLDTVLREEIAGELSQGSGAAVARVRALRRWRAAMLLRHVGTAHGFVRYADAIEGWLAEQESALRLPVLPQHLSRGISNLILPLPTRGPVRVFMAPLRPRTYCLSDDLPKETVLVAVPVNEIFVSIAAHGDALTAELWLRQGVNRPEKLASLAIDLSVARESLLHAMGRTSSFTEIGDTAFARIERARASLISRDRLRSLNAWFTNEHGEPFELRSSTASAALRVQRG